MKRSAVLVALAGQVAACAPRAELCDGTRACAFTADCVAGQCLRKDATLPYVGTRRFVLAPVDMAVLDPGPLPSEGLPPVLTMGRASGSTSLLLRFDLHLEGVTTLVRASILLDRSEATASDPSPIGLRAARVIGAWNPKTVMTSTAPPLQDLRLPSTWVDPSGPMTVRVDVTSLARRWQNHDPGDHGVIIVAENATPVGVTFALPAYSSKLELDGRQRDDLERGASQPPRLEIYVR